VDHVRQWRASHPGYWRRPKARSKPARSEVTVAAASANNHQPNPTPPLQDSIERNPLILGLVARVFGGALQDCVEKVIPELILKGKEIRALMDEAKTICKK
jgi:hypothetical protein